MKEEYDFNFPVGPNEIIKDAILKQYKNPRVAIHCVKWTYSDSSKLIKVKTIDNKWIQVEEKDLIAAKLT